MKLPGIQRPWGFQKQIVAIALILIASTAGAHALINGQAPAFQLTDQFGNAQNLSALNGRLVVLLASDKKGEEQCRAWGLFLKGAYGDRLEIVRIADVGPVPSLFRGAIRNDLKRDPAAILLDWDGLVFKSYAFKQATANVALIDRNGLIRFLHSGPVEREACDRLRKAVHQAE